MAVHMTIHMRSLGHELEQRNQKGAVHNKPSQFSMCFLAHVLYIMYTVHMHKSSLIEDAPPQ